MNDNTGEIRTGGLRELQKLFDEGWRPIVLKKGQVIEIEGFRFEIMSSKITAGRPGMVTLELKGLGRKKQEWRKEVPYEEKNSRKG